MKLTFKKGCLVLNQDCKIMSDIENENGHTIRLQTEDIHNIEIFGEEIQKCDCVNLDGRVIINNFKINFEKHEDYIIINLNIT